MLILTDQERVGTTIAGRYRLDGVLGKGGMGTVFRGVHTWTAREVAVKLLHPQFATDANAVTRFLQEAKAAATIKHPHVVDVLDMGQSEDGAVYLVLEFLHGEPLGDRIARGPMSVDQTLTLLLPLLDALGVAHSRGIVHRDLKPDNLFMSIDGNGRTVPKLLDFGLAKVAGSVTKTGSGVVVGTPLYMSPEQARGLSDLGPASDVWSMGVVLYECLTGQVPFNAESPSGVIVAILTTSARSVGSLGVPVPPSIAAVVDRALVADVGARFANGAALAYALQAAANGLDDDERTAVWSGVVPKRAVALQVAPTTPVPTESPDVESAPGTSGSAQPVPNARPKHRAVLLAGTALAAMVLGGFGIAFAVQLGRSNAPTELPTSSARPEPNLPVPMAPLPPQTPLLTAPSVIQDAGQAILISAEVVATTPAGSGRLTGRTRTRAHVAAREAPSTQTIDLGRPREHVRPPSEHGANGSLIIE